MGGNAVDDGHDDVAHERSEEHTSELQSQSNLVCRLLLEKKKKSSSRHQSDKRAMINIQSLAAHFSIIPPSLITYPTVHALLVTFRYTSPHDVQNATIHHA